MGHRKRDGWMRAAAGVSVSNLGGGQYVDDNSPIGLAYLDACAVTTSIQNVEYLQSANAVVNWCATGFYSFCSNQAEYGLGSPLFDRVTLYLAGGRQAVFKARSQGSESVYVSKLFVDRTLRA